MTVETFTPGSQPASAPNIAVSDAAKAHFIEQLQDHADANGVRISVKTSGCSGYMYVLDYAAAPDANDTVLDVNEQLALYVDTQSLPIISGTQIDYITQGLNRSIQFKNPNVTGECGCGESFTVG